MLVEYVNTTFYKSVNFYEISGIMFVDDHLALIFFITFVFISFVRLSHMDRVKAPHDDVTTESTVH